MNYCVAFINDNNQKEPYCISNIQLNISFSSFFEVINKTSGTPFKLYVMVDFA